MRCTMAGVLLLGVTALAPGAAPPASGPVRLTAEQLKHVQRLSERAHRAESEGDFEVSARLLGEIATYREQHQGARNWEAISARRNAESGRRLARMSAGERAKVARAAKDVGQGMRLYGQGRYREAEALLRQALAVRREVLGEEDPETATCYTSVGVCLHGQNRYAQAQPMYEKGLAIYRKVLGEEHPHTAIGWNNVGQCLNEQGKYADALPLLRRALLIQRKVLGEQHADTARSYNNVAICLERQGKRGEALSLYRRALALFRTISGEEHANTANAYHNLANCLDSQGLHAEAQALHRRALAIARKALGEQHPHTAIMYSEMASCLDQQGKYGEALPLYQKALAIQFTVWGREHPQTAVGYNYVALCLHHQGKHAEALPLYRRALAIRRVYLGEQHPDTATSYGNLALCLNSLGLHAEAQELFEKALDIRLKSGVDRFDKALAYHNLAGCLNDQGKHAEALPVARRALGICRKVLGEEDPFTAICHLNEALCLNDLGKHGEALSPFRTALGIFRKVLGEYHPHTALAYHNVAGCLFDQGKYKEAAEHWESALLGFEHGRLLVGASGFDRARFRSRDLSPHGGLALCRLRLGEPERAWQAAESDLARGLLDDFSSADRQDSRDAQRLARLRLLDGELLALASRSELTVQQKKQREDLLRQRDGLQGDLARELARRARQRVLPLERIVKQVPAGTALVFWLEELDQHHGCVLRRDGKPTWVRLPGTGKAGAWTEEDRHRTAQAHLALFASRWRPDERDAYLARAEPAVWRRMVQEAFKPDRRKAILQMAYQQRLAPLERHLEGVKHLLVVPSGRMSSLPVEALTDRYTVSYTPSASIFARLGERHRRLEGSSLLVLADPTFERTPEKQPPPPGHGLLVAAVVPGGVAAGAGLSAGDVLLSYDSVPLYKLGDLVVAEGERRVVVKLWRDGQTLTGRIPTGKLGVVLDRRPLAEALAAWRKQESALLSLERASTFAALPGTRLEARLLKGLVPSASVVLGSAASQQNLDRLARAGALKDYRLLHLASHGQANPDHPDRTALILAQDRLPTLRERSALVLQGQVPPDGRLTVHTIRTRWKLDADLVVLSACESGLGAQTNREGMLGFAHALLQSGAHSVVLSRWKVDDSATALLMMRFYQNLLGKRAGLKEGMPRAEALREAKTWLRQLRRAEAERLLAGLLDGVPRGERASIKKALPLRKPDAGASPRKQDRPFDEPYFWAAFVLLGDPD
jgi:CHAT domain-containing protein/tetratricopeptide (TPR) repeat protein